MNKRIEVLIDLFNCLNLKLDKDSNPLGIFFHNLKINFIKILNDIVKHYTFVHPDNKNYKGKCFYLSIFLILSSSRRVLFKW